MKIALIGASGFVGSALLKEAVGRGYQVTAIARHPENILAHPGVTARKADVFDTSQLASVLKGHDVVIGSYNPGWTNPNIYSDTLKAYASIQEAVRESGVRRFFVIGGAGSLEIALGAQWVDNPKFPNEYRDGARGLRDYLNVLRKEDKLDWTFFSPAIEMHQGIKTGRTGKYRLGTDQPVYDTNNRSILSVEDLSIAVIDELENKKFIRKRFTAAY